MAPIVLQSGSLSRDPFIDVVMEARNAPDPCILEVVGDTGSRSFYFRDGALVALVSSNASESFASMLVKRRKIQSAVSDSIIEVAARDGLTPAQVMLRDRVLPIPELVQEISLWGTLLLIETFSWSDGDYRIIAESEDNAPPETLFELNLASALRKGVFKRVPMDDVRAMLRPFHSSRPRAARPLPFALVAFDLDGYQQGFWESLDGARTIDDILDLPPIPPDDAARLLFVFHRTGMITFSEREVSVETAAPSMSLDDLFGAIEEAEALGGVAQEPPRTQAPPAAPVGPSGVDMSAIRFHRREAAETSSGTFHSVTPHSREEVATTASGVFKVAVGIGQASEVGDLGDGGDGESLSGLFDDLDLDFVGGPAESAQIAPPRGGARGAAWKEASTPGSSVSPPKATPMRAREPEIDPDGPPVGAGPVIEREDWDRLTTKDKDRIRGLSVEIDKMTKTNYFEWFGVSHEAPVGSIKKAYFQMAKLYHPDSLLDEPGPFRAVAEALFSNYSTAYETLSDDEARDKYIRKAVHGEKDENDLAMEQVQRILAAENSFKTGLRFMANSKIKDALRHFKAAVEGYPEEAEYVAYYGYVLFRARINVDPESADEGLEIMKRATRLKELAPKPWHLLGKSYLLKGEPLSAKRYLRRSLKLQADNPEAIRDYRKADELSKSGGSTGASKAAAPKGARKSGLFGLFGRKKEAPKEEEDPFEGMDLDF